MVEVLIEYLSVPRLLAILLLPVALFPDQPLDISLINNPTSEYNLPSPSRWVFLAMYLSQKINTYIMYNHIGLGPLKNLQSNRIWGALRKSFA